MKFTRQPLVIDAFRAGIDPIPEWFMDRVTSGEVILKPDHNIEGSPWCLMMRWNGSEIEIKKGDYIIKSMFPFTTYTPDHFLSTYLKGNLNEVYSLGFRVNNIIEEVGLSFENKEEVYNSLHEDLRDLRRVIVSGSLEEIRELLLQIAATSLKGFKDLLDGNQRGVYYDGEC